jgi:O-antigen/teichoic acid export membrane protein
MKSLLTYSLIYAGAAGLQKALGFFVYMWLAYTLTVQDYATFGLLLALQSGITTLAGAGITDSLVGLIKGDRWHKMKMAFFRAANGSFLYLSLVAVAIVVIIYSLPIWDVRLGIGVQVSVLIGGVLTAFFTLQAGLVRLDERHLASVAFLFMGPVTGLAFGFAAVYFSRNVEFFFGGFAIGLLLIYYISFVMRVGYFGFALKLSEVEPISRSIGPYILIALLAWLTGYGNTYIVKFLFSDGEVARFTFIYTLASIMHLVATSTNQVWGPRFLKLIAEADASATEKHNVRFYMAQGFILGSIGAIILLLVPTSLKIIGGNFLSYQDINTELFLLFFAYAVSIPWWHAQNYYIVNSFGGVLKNLILISTFLGILFSFALMYIFGVIGIYLGILLQALIRSLFVFLWARKKWQLLFAWQGSLVAVCLFLAGSLGGVKIVALVN